MNATVEYSRDEIEAQVARILASPEFEASPRSSQLLTYLVGELLEGRGHLVKGYSIGVEVFGRDEGFDPQADTVVRVQAGRLRRSLELYYSRSGADDDIEITLPKGSYVPKIAARGAGGAEPARDDAAPGPVSGGAGPAAWSLALVALSAVLVAVAGALWWQSRTGDEGSGDAARTERSAYDERPTLAVIPFTAPGDLPSEMNLAWGLSRQLVTDLARFRQILVVGVGEVTGAGVDAQAPEMARFVLTGTTRIVGASVRVTAHLTDVGTSGVLWSQTFDHSGIVQTMVEIEGEVSREIASTLGQAYGVISTIEQRRVAEQDEENAAYACLLRFYQYAAERTAAEHARVRDCLEAAIADQPGYAPAWAALSSIYGDEIRYGFNRRTDVNAVTRSVEAAEEGVRRDPYDPMPHQYLAAALFMDGTNDARVREELERALELNPYSSDLLANAGWTIAVMGGWTRGVELMRQAMELNPSHPRWYNGILAVHDYLRADYDAAVTEARRYFQPEVLFSHVLLTASLARAGRWDEGYEAGQQLMEAFPSFPVDGRAELASWRFAPQVINRLFSGLTAVGLAVQPPASSAEPSL